MDDTRKGLMESIEIRQALLADSDFFDAMNKTIALVEACFRQDGKLLLCGNGGSAADAQHIAAELSGRFKQDRRPLFAEALHVNTSYLTAVANDYGYDEVFARMVRAMGREGDVLIGFSTSGNSLNVIRALEAAREAGLKTIALLGKNSGKMASLADVAIHVPSTDTARIQEVHITLGHILCEQIEKRLFA